MRDRRAERSMLARRSKKRLAGKVSLPTGS